MLIKTIPCSRDYTVFYMMWSESVFKASVSSLLISKRRTEVKMSKHTSTEHTHTHSHSGKLTRKNGMRKIKVADEPHAVICYCDAEPGLLLAGLRPRAASAS